MMAKMRSLFLALLAALPAFAATVRFVAPAAGAPPYRVTFDFGTSLMAHRIVAYVRSHRFQQTDAGEVRTAAVGGETITVNLVEAPLRVQATSKATGTAKDFSVVEE